MYVFGSKIAQASENTAFHNQYFLRRRRIDLKLALLTGRIWPYCFTQFFSNCDV